MNLADLLEEQAAGHPDAVAVIERHGRVEDRRTSFAQLERAAAGASESFACAGIGLGDVVIVLVPMSAELYEVLLGLWRIGAVAMLVDASAGEERIAACCRAVPPQGIVLSAKAHLLLLRSATLRSVPLRFSTSARPIPGSQRVLSPGAPRHALPVADLPSEAPALVTFTSGSTGAPKAVSRSHGFLLAQHAVLSRVLEPAPGQVDLATLPVFVLTNLASGTTTVIPDADLRSVGSIDAAPVLRQMERLGVTGMVASPAFLRRLVEEAESTGTQMTSLRSVHTGGGPVLPSVLRRTRAVAPHARIVAVYGSTEAEPIAEQDWDEVDGSDIARTRSGGGLLAGRPVDAAVVRVARLSWGEPAGQFTPEEFALLLSAQDAPGEIVVTGDHVLKGYLDSRRDAETKFRVADVTWHRTGDLGTLDAQGRLWLLGRSGSEVAGIFPLGVESALDETPGLVRSALTSDALGRPLLAVQSDGTLDVDALKAHARAFGIDDVRLVAEVPMDARHNAKVDYTRLGALLDPKR